MNLSTTIAMCGLLLLSATIHASEVVVDAALQDAWPVYEDSVTNECAPTPPPDQLVDLVSWDLCLGEHATRSRALRGYEASYEWNGRTIKRFMRGQPPARLPVRLSITPVD